MTARKRVGLALGAGSAKGLAHIGVIRALKEHDIPIDCIAGCSMGAIIGSMYACGTDLERLPGFLNAIDEKRFFDYTTSRRGLIAGNNFEDFLKLFTHTMNFEDLDFPYVCIAVDYLKARVHIFDKGPIYKAVRCSMSIPGVIAPSEYLGTIFVDGSVMERVPITACRTLRPDVVIGVDVGYAGTPMERPKSMLSIVRGCSDIMVWENTKKQIADADYMIMPRVSHIHSYSLKESDACIEMGYQETLEQVEAIKALIQ